MTIFSPQDKQFMQHALHLAQQGQYTTTPNPRVGCVLVKNGEIIGEGFHLKAGEPHAEVMALRDAQKKNPHLIEGSTAYVTLEPCSHFGRTPPCALALIKSKVAKVVVAMTDPNPLVAGKGLKMLEEVGIETQCGLCNTEAEQLNRPFLTKMRMGLPFVQLKMAMSLDGRTAMANGESQWISNEKSRQDVQDLRAKSCAILSTSATVLKDDPLLTVRHHQLPKATQESYPLDHLRQPVRIILDRHHKVPPSAKLFTVNAPVWLVSAKARDMSLYPDFCQEVIIDKEEDNGIHLPRLLKKLAEKNINSLWLEVGNTLAGAFIEQGLVNELIIYLAPKLLGNDAKGLCYLPHLQQLKDAPEFLLMSIEQIDSDLKLIYHPK